MLWLKKQNLIMCVITLLTAGVSALASAKPVNLYDLPKTDSKVVGTVDSSSSMVPIFTNKEGDWMKVGDPKNGNVGWVKLSDFNNAKSGTNSSGFSMTEQTISTKDGPKTYRTIQFGNDDQTSAQAQLQLKQIQQQSKEMQKRTQAIMENIYRDMNSLYQVNPVGFNNQPYPLLMPVIIVPAPALPANNTASKPAAKS